MDTENTQDTALIELYKSRAEVVRSLIGLNASYTYAGTKEKIYKDTLAGIDTMIEKHLNAYPKSPNP